MENINFDGVVKEILYRGENLFRFLIVDENRGVVATVVKNNIGIAEIIEVGKRYKVLGNFNYYDKKKVIDGHGSRVINNVLYVDAIMGLESEVVNGESK